MGPAGVAPNRRRAGPRSVGLVTGLAVAVAWVALAVASWQGWAQLTDHDSLVHHHLPVLGVAAFLLAWQVMIAAMMLPSTAPVLQLFHRAGAAQPDRRRATGAFVAGYAAVWSAFAVAALAFDLAVHRTVDSWAWLQGHPWWVACAVLALVGAFQLSPVRARCQHMCRHPVPYLMAHYEPGARAGWRLGWSHGLFCLGCCWALMLLMFAVGLANLAWMALLAVVMTYEKVGRRGDGLARVVGLVLVGWAVLAALHPGWLPPGLGGPTQGVT